MNLLDFFALEPLLPSGATAGAYQTYLFFDFAHWTTGNALVYAVCLAVVLLAVNANKVWSVLGRRCLSLPISGTTLAVMTLAMVVVALLNLSLPGDEAHAGQADPFFVLVSMLSLAVAVKAFVLVSRHATVYRRSTTRFERSASLRNLLLWGALAGWALAFLCYFVGMYADGTQRSLLAALLRPSMMASKMFVLLDNMGEIAAPFKQNGAFMGFYAFTKLYVLVITSSTFITIVWHRLSAYISLHTSSSRGKRLFVFFGLNSSGRLLAQDVVRSIPEDQRMLLFVDSKESSSEPGNFLSVTGVVGLFGHRREAFDFTDALNAHLLIGNVPIDSNESVALLNDPAAAGRLMESMGLGELERLCGEADQVMMFFLGADEGQNMKGASNMRAILNHDLPNGQFRLFVLAGNTPEMQSLQTTEEGNQVEIIAIDQGQMAVQTLFRAPENHPVNFVETDPATAAVKSRFEAMVIGFGRTGQEMVRMLYEFGAFLDSRCASSGSRQTFRSPFRCTVVDAEMERTRRRFLHQYPLLGEACNYAAVGDGNVYSPSVGDPLLTFHKASAVDGAFVDLMAERIASLNYIVVSLDNDKQNLEVLDYVVGILMRTRGKALGNVAIYVQNCDDKESATMQRMADYYNRLCVGDGTLVKVFGTPKNLMTFDLIVNERIQQCARQFYGAYCAATNATGAMDWDARHKMLLGFSATPQSSAWETLSKIRRQELQEVHNYLHMATKRQLIGEQTPTFIEQYEQSQLLLNLSRGEHLRWVASHEALGYVLPSDPRQTWCDETAKTHHCLVEWEDLPRLSALYNSAHPDSPLDYCYLDYVVVRVSFELYNT